MLSLFCSILLFSDSSFLEKFSLCLSSFFKKLFSSRFDDLLSINVTIADVDNSYGELTVYGSIDGRTFDGSFNEPPTVLGWVKIGVHRNGSQHHFHGNIDEVSIWNVAQTQEQIQDYMYSEHTH